MSVEVLLLKQSCRDVRAERCLALSVGCDFLLVSGEDTSYIELDAELSVLFGDIHSHSLVKAVQEVAVDALLVRLVVLEDTVFGAVVIVIFFPVGQDIRIAVFIATTVRVT